MNKNHLADKRLGCCAEVRETSSTLTSHLVFVMQRTQRLVSHLTDKRAARDVEVRPPDSDDIVSRVGDLILHFIQIIPCVDGVDILHCVWPGATDSH